MSKKRRKSEFGAPTKTTERYYEALSQSDSGPTIEKADEENTNASKATDAILPDDISLPEKKKGFRVDWENLGKIGLLITIILAIGAVVRFTWETNVSVSLTRNEINRVEGELKDFSKDSRAQQDEIKMALVRVLEKFERLFDILSKSKK